MTFLGVLGRLGLSWGHLGEILEVSWGVWGCLGDVVEASWAILIRKVDILKKTLKTWLDIRTGSAVA